MSAVRQSREADYSQASYQPERLGEWTLKLTPGEIHRIDRRCPIDIEGGVPRIAVVEAGRLSHRMQFNFYDVNSFYRGTEILPNGDIREAGYYPFGDDWRFDSPIVVETAEIDSWDRESGVPPQGVAALVPGKLVPFGSKHQKQFITYPQGFRQEHFAIAESIYDPDTVEVHNLWHGEPTILTCMPTVQEQQSLVLKPTE